MTAIFGFNLVNSLTTNCSVYQLTVRRPSILQAYDLTTVEVISSEVDASKTHS